MTELALELDEKLAHLAPAKARALERRVREAIALAEADLSSNAEVAEGGRLDWLEMQVQPFPLPTADYERLAETLDQPPRKLPRLRELLKEASKFHHD